MTLGMMDGTYMHEKVPCAMRAWTTGWSECTEITCFELNRTRDIPVQWLGTVGGSRDPHSDSLEFHVAMEISCGGTFHESIQSALG